jgi:two-component system nitrate/nitrite response regulator NarL
MRCTSVVIADRYPVVLLGLSAVLAAHRDFNIVASCSDGTSCIEALRNLAPNIAILDVSMPGVTGLEILSIVNSEKLSTRLVFLTASDEDSDLVMSAAADGYSVIPKDVAPEVLVQSLRQIAEGQRLLPLLSSEQAISRGQSAITGNALTTLTDRERQIMRLVSEGLSNKEIGRRLNIADGTIKVHLHNIFQKLEISNRTVLAALAISQNDRAGPPAD